MASSPSSQPTSALHAPPANITPTGTTSTIATQKMIAPAIAADVSSAKVTDSAKEITEYFTDNQDALKVGNFLGGLSIIALLWFLGSLFGRLRKAEGGTSRVSGIALTGGVTTAAVAAVAYGINAVGVLHAPQLSEVSFKISTLLFAYLGFAAAAFVLGASIVILRTKLLPAWVAYLGAVSALLWVVGGVRVSSTRDVWAGIAFAAYLVWSLWILVVSVLLYQKQDA